MELDVSLSRSGLRLRTKLYLSFGAVLMLGAFVALLMLVMMDKSTRAYKKLLETDRRVAEIAISIQVDKLRISGSLRGRLLHPYGEFGDKEILNLNSAYSDINSDYALAEKLITDSQMTETLNQIQEIDQRQLLPMENRILDAIKREESAEAETLYFDEYLHVLTVQQRLLDHLNILASKRISDSVQSTQDQARLGRALAIGTTVILIVIGCFLSFYLTRSFERPISQLMVAARSIAGGDLTQKLALDRPDELGEMADVLNQMVSHLRTLNTDLADQVRWLSETKEELSRTQGKLVQQEKMAALGKLVAGVAHELNNPISFVYSNTILIKESIAEFRKVFDFYDLNDQLPEEIRTQAAALKEEVDYDYLVNDISQTIDDCHEGARRVRDIVMNLKSFSRLNDSDRQVVDLTESIESTVRILGQYFRPGQVTLHRDFAGPIALSCHPGQLSQVWMNLLVNAAQAMNGCGDLWLKTLVEDNQVVITVRDSGPGISEDIVRNIFDPFFTTKPVGEGTGLGLSIVHSTVERHGGEITVESSIGAGALFTIKLPLTPGDIAAEAAAGPEMAVA